MRIRVLLLFFAALPSLAQTPSLTINWYKPFSFSPPLKNHTTVTLYGKAEAGYSITVDHAAIVAEDPSLLASISQLVKGDILNAVPDAGGYFQLSMTLPRGLVQVPIKILAPSGSETVYVVSLQVEKDKVTASLPIKPDEPTVADWRQEIKQFVEKKYGLGVVLAKQLKGLWLSIAGGFNYQSHSQTLGSSTTLGFQSLDFPSLGIKASQVGEKWIFSGEYKYQPGKVSKVSSPFTMSDREFEWSSFTLEGGRNWKNDFFGPRSRFTYLFGLQHHQLPFFQIQTGNEVEIKTLVMTNLSMGAMFTFELNKRTWFESFMRYQVPYSAGLLATSSQVSVDPKFAFDGSLGILFERRKNQYVGIYWLGQWHSYSFTSKDAVDLTETKGSQSLFYSNIDLRYIWRF
jgi:hypothetical protein